MNRIVLFALALSFMFTAGCWKTYDTPEYAEIGPNETAFLVPLEGDTSQQAKLASLEKLKEQKVATKRVQITHRWNQTGRWEHEGQWIPNVKLIKVDRSPVTREWTADNNTGTANKNQALWAESKDSVGFSTGFNVTVMVTEEDAAAFLYNYAGKNLADVVDNQVRGRIQSVFSDFAAKYDMSDLRGKKGEMMTAIREDVISYFKPSGITISSIGQFSGFCYENKDIQASIDKVFIAQREKEVAAAILDAQKDKNARVVSEADAMALAEAKKAEGIANGKLKVLEVARQAAKDPVFLELRRLEVEEQRIQRWDGKYPTYYMGLGSSGTNLGMLLNIPEPAKATKVEAQ